jgi:cysteine-rich repeat protein
VPLRRWRDRPPAEECDLGDAANGAVDSPCSATCEILGSCTGSGFRATTRATARRRGCCGNAISEGDEECDDGNNISDDLCNGSCF